MLRRDFVKKSCLVGSSSLLLCWGLGWFPERSKSVERVFSSTTQKNQTQEIRLYEEMGEERVRCTICFRNCVMAPGERGFCGNREYNQGQVHTVVYGRPSAVMVDPVEKEPQYHFRPGTQMLCVGTAGCNFRCKFCHNHHLSQRSIEELGYYHELSPHDLVEEALKRGIPSISFTYNEPTSFYEYMYHTAKKGKEEGLNCIVHSNGAMNPEPLYELLPYVDAITIDLKAFDDDFYKNISRAQLDPVLKTLQIIYQEGVWLEIVNLLITDLNDDPSMIRAMCIWIQENLGDDVPLHLNRFFPAYRMADATPTPIHRIEEAYHIAKEEGLKYVYIGNVPGHPYNSSYCTQCSEVLIKRQDRKSVV